MNEIYKRLLEIISKHPLEFKSVLDADSTKENKLDASDFFDYLEFSVNEEYLSKEINTSIIITNGDVYVTLKVIHDLAFKSGNFIIFINENNAATNYYFVTMANKIYEDLELDVHIKIDLNRNYNSYITKEVTLIGNEKFINEAKNDFEKCNYIVL